MKCRHCKKNLIHTFADLGKSPPSNSYLTKDSVNKHERWYKLKVMVCDGCWLVQTLDFVKTDEMFSDDYAYFSSYSETWLLHAKIFVHSMLLRFNLNKTSTVLEVAANDGYLLQYVKESNIYCYGIEPTKSTAVAAREKGIEIIESFFCVEVALGLVKKNKQADLTIANNVLAHVPDINDFVKAFSIILKSNGVATFEFPHLLNLVEGKQFDTIYHEHFSYLSLKSVQTIFKKCGLSIFDVEELSTHGGSLRVYAQRSDTGTHPLNSSVQILTEKEKKIGMDKLEFYTAFQVQIENIKSDFVKFLYKAKKDDKKVAAYGAAAKGNTILNFSKISKDLISFVVDKNPAKVGKFMPGSHIPIFDEDYLKKEKPDFILILPWNLEKEIKKQLAYINNWEGKFVMIIPEMKFSIE